jgi:integrative and conjugative element protein (TIGR02256 family)
MKWFKKHPEHLESEVRELETNSNYQVGLTYRDNLLVSCGEIIVRQVEAKKFPILIVYPESTPYSLPKVFLLDGLLSDEEVRKVSSLNLSQVSEYIKNRIRFYHLRHQGEDGSLCLLESDNLYLESAQIYSIRQVIGRLRHWFGGLDNGRLPPDSPEVELFFHFRNRDKTVEFLLPDFVFDDTLSDGIIYAAQTPTPQRLKKNYIAVAIFGRNKSGVIEPPRVYDRQQHLLYTQSPKPEEIIRHETGNEQEDIQAKLKSEELIKVYWFDISFEPKPFEKVEELLYYVGDGDGSIGKNRLVGGLGNAIGKSNLIYIGLRFPGRRQGKEWQLFVLKKRPDSPYLLDDSLDAKYEMLSNYDIAAIYSEVFTDQGFHARNSILANRDILKNLKITVIGCGALGSEIADILAKAGLGQICLIDKDIMRAHNAVRHLVAIDRMGIPKVWAVAERLILHNPFVDVDYSDGYNLVDILMSNINEYFLEGSIGVSTVADDNVESFLNEQAIVYNKIVFYTRALRGGKVARIFRVIPGEDACKNCLALYYKDKDPRFIAIPEDETLPTIANECNNPIRPASAADLKLIAAISSRLIIDYLQRGEGEKNHWVWTTEEAGVIGSNAQSPFSVHASFLPPHPNCKYCRKEDPIQIIISEAALKYMENEISRGPSLETGGILIGYDDQAGRIYVETASGPGPKAIRETASFSRDVEYCQAIVDDNYRKYGDKGLYVGEWHYHPSSNNQPSNLDLLSLTKIAEQKEYVLDKPIMIIFSNKLDLSCTVHPFNKKYYSAAFTVRQTNKAERL